MAMSAKEKAKRSARFHQMKPWLLAKDSGPKTTAGRAQAGRNALKHGARSAGMQALGAWLRSLRPLTNRR